MDDWIKVQFFENQAPIGAFGDGAQPVLDTEQGLLALHGASPANFTVNLVARARAAYDFLTASQGQVGDWEGSVYATALVLRALASQRPNLSVSTDELGRPYLVFSNPNPLSGDPVKVLSAVVNRSGVQAPASIARFYAVDEAGGPVRMLGESAVRALEAGESADLSLTLPSSGLSGRQIIRVAFDADNTISETDKSDNTAEGVLEIRRAVNLLTTRTDISFSEEETQLTIRARLHCRGEATGPFSVRIFRGNPDTGGLPMGTTTLEGLGPGETTEVTATIDRPESEGPLAFYVVVDPFDEVSEANEIDSCLYIQNSL